MEYSKNTIRKLLQERGAKDISDKAAEEFGELLELFAGYITEEAVGIASEDGRNVLRKDDIQEALED